MTIQRGHVGHRGGFESGKESKLVSTEDARDFENAADAGDATDSGQVEEELLFEEALQQGRRVRPGSDSAYCPGACSEHIESPFASTCSKAQVEGSFGE